MEDGGSLQFKQFLIHALWSVCMTYWSILYIFHEDSNYSNHSFTLFLFHLVNFSKVAYPNRKVGIGLWLLDWATKRENSLVYVICTVFHLRLRLYRLLFVRSQASIIHRLSIASKFLYVYRVVFSIRQDALAIPLEMRRLAAEDQTER